MLDPPELSPFAEELIPEAFTRRHTAFRVHRVDEPLSGEPGFGLFVDSLLRYTLGYRCDCGLFPSRMVVVEDGDGICWYWDEETPWPPSWTVERVRREARSLPEPWLFAIELPRPDPASEPTWWDGITAPVTTVPPPRDLSWTAVWYAEARGRGMAQTGAGIVQLEHVPWEDMDRVVDGMPIAPADHPTTRDFHRILYAHPARKQHPLRGGRRRV